MGANNEIIISGRDLQDYLSYFNLPINFNFMDLTTSKYLLSKDNNDTNKINEIYKSLYNLKLNDLTKIYPDKEFDIYKKSTLLSFQKMYGDFPIKYKNNEELNKTIDDVKNIVESNYNELENANSKEEIDTLNENFLANYDAYLSKFLLEYSKALNERNNNKMQGDIDLITKEYIKDGKKISRSLNENLKIYNDIVMKRARSYRFQNIIIGQISEYFKDIDNFFDNKNYSDILEKYYDMIDNFVTTKYNQYINEVKGMNIEKEDEIDNISKKILNNIQDDVTVFSNNVYKLAYQDVKSIIDNNISNPDDAMLMFELKSKIKEVHSFEELSNIYKMINNNDDSIGTIAR